MIAHTRASKVFAAISLLLGVSAFTALAQGPEAALAGPGGKRSSSDRPRVPLIVRGPGVPAGVQLDHFVLNIDFASTLAELAGAAPPGFIDGKSLLPLLRPNPPAPQLETRFPR